MSVIVRCLIINPHSYIVTFSANFTQCALSSLSPGQTRPSTRYIDTNVDVVLVGAMILALNGVTDKSEQQTELLFFATVAPLVGIRVYPGSEQLFIARYG